MEQKGELAILHGEYEDEFTRLHDACEDDITGLHYEYEEDLTRLHGEDNEGAGEDPYRVVRLVGAVLAGVCTVARRELAGGCTVIRCNVPLVGGERYRHLGYRGGTIHKNAMVN